MLNSMSNTELSSADYAARMLECTDENGVLSIYESHFTDGLTDFDESAERSFEMTWTAEELQKVIQAFQALYGNLAHIAEYCLSTGLDPHSDACFQAVAEAQKWLEGGILDDTVVWRAKRICVLMALRAPEVILCNEAQRLIEALALTRFAKREICK